VYDYIVDVIDFTYQIFLVNLETREIKRLTNEGSNSSPAWSPDGTKIVFSSSRNGDNDLYIMDREGTNQQQITDLDGNELVPDWSPDGESIAFLSTYEGAEGIYVVDVSSRTISQLTHNLVDFSPRWSSNGKKIVFTSHLDTTATYEPSQIYVMNEDGSQVQQLTNDKYRNISPFWCPDDSCVVYERYTGEGNIRKLMVFDLVSYEAKPLLTGAYETKSTSSEFCNSRSPIRGYFTIILEESMVYAFDIKNNRLYSLGIQAMNVSLFP
jgi:Tol biopolymer transport system component